MAKTRFWRLDWPKSDAKLARWVQDEVELESIVCAADDGHKRGGRRLGTLSVTLPEGAVQDIVWTWHGECLLRDSVIELFKANGFSGFDVKPVKAKFTRSDGAPPRLWELVVTGWGGVAPPESGIKLLEHCPACKRWVYSVWTSPENLIDPDQWDGSDFFRVWPVGSRFVTERVVQVIRDNRLSGVVVTPQEDLVFPPSVIPEMTTGPLSNWLPPERARELGAALGID